jgi:hypothetical protein
VSDATELPPRMESNSGRRNGAERLAPPDDVFRIVLFAGLEPASGAPVVFLQTADAGDKDDRSGQDGPCV